MSTIALILKIAFEIIRRFQKPHYSSNQNKNSYKNKQNTNNIKIAPVRAWHYYSFGHGALNSELFWFPFSRRLRLL